MREPGFFEVPDNTRAIKRLKPDSVPPELIRRILDAGTKAPGFPQGRFGPVTRIPAQQLTHFDRWGRQDPREDQ